MISNGQAMLDAEALKRPLLESPMAYAKEVLNLHKNGMPAGSRTGWESLDQLYTVVAGQLNIVTGFPSSGKSEFIDALMLNLAKQGWKFSIFSFENMPVEYHITKMLEKLAGKPFGLGLTTRIQEDELTELTDQLAQSFAFTGCSSGDFKLKDILDAAQKFLCQFPDSPRGIVIDPWNELSHQRPQGLSETEYISQTLSNIRNWCRINKVAAWIIAHPQKLKREEGKLPVPRPDMISGSAHFWNKADCALTVWRDNENPDSNAVEIHVQKCRFKHIGRTGMVTLMYDRVTGRYHEF